MDPLGRRCVSLSQVALRARAAYAALSSEDVALALKKWLLGLKRIRSWTCWSLK